MKLIGSDLEEGGLENKKERRATAHNFLTEFRLINF